MQTENSAAIWTAKNTAFSRNITLQFGDKLISKNGPLLMGIINLTNDSFFAGSRFQKKDEILKQAEKMIAEGADILDVGAVSTRPGAKQIPEKDEIVSLLPAIKSIVQHFPKTAISIDTYRTNVAKAAIEAGAFMINDISGGTFDSEMPSFIGRLNIPYVLMHIVGTPENMQENPIEKDAVQQVLSFFRRQLKIFGEQGASQIILDPGFGFGKTLDANYSLLASLPQFKSEGLPVLVGVSRKSMIHKVLQTKAEDALNGTTVLHTFAIMNGADILRVHDIRQASEVVKLCMKYTEVMNNPLNL